MLKRVVGGKGRGTRKMNAWLQCLRDIEGRVVAKRGYDVHHSVLVHFQVRMGIKLLLLHKYHK
jgi:hypothetical protein